MILRESKHPCQAACQSTLPVRTSFDTETHTDKMSGWPYRHLTELNGHCLGCSFQQGAMEVWIRNTSLGESGLDVTISAILPHTVRFLIFPWRLAPSSAKFWSCLGLGFLVLEDFFRMTVSQLYWAWVTMFSSFIFPFSFHLFLVIKFAQGKGLSGYVLALYLYSEKLLVPGIWTSRVLLYYDLCVSHTDVCVLHLPLIVMVWKIQKSHG